MTQALSPRIQPLTLAEVIGIATELQALVGAQLQECLQSTAELGLGFYHDRKIRWIWIDLDPQKPMLVLLSDAPKTKKLTRPLSLFIRSHFRGRRLKSVTADIARGRVLKFEFHRSSEEDLTGEISIEVRLLPQGQNILAQFGKKQVSESKPKDLPLAPVELREGELVRSIDDLTQSWQTMKAARSQSAQPKAESLEKDWARLVEKKELALVRMKEELVEKSNDRERRLGEWLKANGSFENLPTEFDDLVDHEKSLAWNIEESFKRAKDKARKIEGTRARIKIVEDEVARLKAEGPKQKTVSEQQKDKGLLAAADAKGRRFKLAEDLDVYIGKSAADNLALLRKAQPFDYWLHLRDQPGSHAILRRTRNRNVTDLEFTQAAKWVIEQSLKKNESELKGERHDVLIVECRFVRPIRGDKLGRVNYSNDRVLMVRF